jgi:hypothetical protein
VGGRQYKFHKEFFVLADSQRFFERKSWVMGMLIFFGYGVMFFAQLIN